MYQIGFTTATNLGRPVHIILSLRCSEQKVQNPPCELLGNYARTLGSSVSVTRGR